jgi:DNA mismatch repair ATPase MutS
MIRVPTRVEQAQHRQAAGNAAVLLYHDMPGDQYVAFRRDAEHCWRFALLGVGDHDETVCAIPASQRDESIRRLVAAGLRVAVLDQIQ